MSVAPVTAGPPSGARLRDLWVHVRRQRRDLWFAGALGVLGTVTSLLQPLVVLKVIEATFEREPWAGLVGVLVVLFVLERARERVVLDLRLGLISRLLRLRMREHDRLRAGDLLARVGTDTTLLRAVVSSGVVDAVRGLIALAGAVAFMAWLDWVLLLIVIAGLLVSGLIVLGVLAGIRDATEHSPAAGSDAAAGERRGPGRPTRRGAGALDAGSCRWCCVSGCSTCSTCQARASPSVARTWIGYRRPTAWTGRRATRTVASSSTIPAARIALRDGSVVSGRQRWAGLDPAGVPRFRAHAPRWRRARDGGFYSSARCGR